MKILELFFLYSSLFSMWEQGVVCPINSSPSRGTHSRFCLPSSARPLRFERTSRACASVWKARGAQSRNFHGTAFFSLFFPGFPFYAPCCETPERIHFLYLVRFSCCLESGCGYFLMANRRPSASFKTVKPFTVSDVNCFP